MVTTLLIGDFENFVGVLLLYGKKRRRRWIGCVRWCRRKIVLRQTFKEISLFFQRGYDTATMRRQRQRRSPGAVKQTATKGRGKSIYLLRINTAKKKNFLPCFFWKLPAAALVSTTNRKTGNVKKHTFQHTLHMEGSKKQGRLLGR